MKCAVCGKESKKELCHSCAIAKSKTGYSVEQLKEYMRKEARVEKLSDVSPFWRGNLKLSFVCSKCGKESVRPLKNVAELLCRQCSYEKSMLEKYGVTNSGQKESTKKKIKKTCDERYGGCFLATEKARDALKKTHEDYFKEAAHSKLDEYSDLVFLADTHRVIDQAGHLHYSGVHCVCKKCGKEYDTNSRRLARCPECYPEDWLNGVSKAEKEIVDYVRSIYKGEVIENDRSLIYPKELDVYIPDLKIAIEYDGDWYHGCHSSNEFTELKKNASLKHDLCQEKDVRLITIKECDWIDRPDVFKRFLKDAIEPKKRVGARDCELKEIDTSTAREFCETYHTDGFNGGFKKYGLFFEGELICVAVFSKNPKYGYECSRLCFKTGYSVTGGWDKIVKHFGQHFVHYVNLQYFAGENKTGAGYRFVKGDEVRSRQSFQKKKDSSLTLLDNAFSQGWAAIFDCGNDIRLF